MIDNKLFQWILEWMVGSVRGFVLVPGKKISLKWYVFHCFPISRFVFNKQTCLPRPLVVGPIDNIVYRVTITYNLNRQHWISILLYLWSVAPSRVRKDRGRNLRKSNVPSIYSIISEWAPHRGTGNGNGIVLHLFYFPFSIGLIFIYITLILSTRFQFPGGR